MFVSWHFIVIFSYVYVYLYVGIGTETSDTFGTGNIGGCEPTVVVLGSKFKSFSRAVYSLNF